jgi:S1-C subfamily serine protease
VLARLEMDVNAGRGLLGMAPPVVLSGAVTALVLAPLFWFASNFGRESLAFSRAQSRATVAAWEEYLRRDTPRHYLEVKQEYLPRAALHAALKKDSATALREVLAKYADTAVIPDAEAALHAVYDKAIAQVTAETSGPARDTMVSLLHWLDQHQTNVVEIRFTASSAAEMSGLDEYIDELMRERRVTSPIAPIGPSLAPEIVARHEAEVVETVKAGFRTLLDSDLVRFERGGTFAGTMTAFDRPTLAFSCFVEPSPQLLRDDDDARKLYLRLAFNAEYDLVVPGSQPYTSAFQVNFVDKLPRSLGKGNLYDGMVAFTYEEIEQNLGTNFFPQHLPERKVRTTEVTPAPAPRTSGLMFTATGFSVSPEGYIATAHHFTSKARTYRVITPTGPIAAELVVSDPENDLAIIKIARALPAALSLRPSNSVKLGEAIATIGFPQTQVQGREPKIGRGEIASLAGMRDDPKMFQVSVPIQPGNSGGPLLDVRGNVVGVVVAALTRAQSVNYAVKSSHLIELCQRVPELRNLTPPSTATPPAFEDMIQQVRQATVLIEGYQ